MLVLTHQGTNPKKSMSRELRDTLYKGVYSTA